MTCVQDPLPQPAGNFLFALGFRDLLVHEHRFVGVKEGQLLWQTASHFNYDAWVVDV
ncbi:MAG: hypothetical protein NZ869_07990 [Thermoanaerobaculum sp.]|nr:hypothetical protein [Thermoanaerobaculum sp.]MDW7966982.1 hypothetical protein [Thermoanaerobaculum sp.]